jgi:hypothetical protein
MRSLGNASEGAPRTPRWSQLASLVTGLVVVGVACSGTSTTPVTTVRQGGCGSNAVAAVKEFIATVQRNDVAGYRRCEHDESQVSADFLEVLATGHWLVDTAAITTDVLPPPAPGEAVVRVPAPDQPGDTVVDGTSIVRRPPHASGVLVTAASDEAGAYYITKVEIYAST